MSRWMMGDVQASPGVVLTGAEDSYAVYSVPGRCIGLEVLCKLATSRKLCAVRSLQCVNITLLNAVHVFSFSVLVKLLARILPRIFFGQCSKAAARLFLV